MRLNLFISKAGVASRRKADILIKDGKVAVNAKVTREPFFSVEERDKVTVEEKLITLQKHIYVIFHKPCGVTTTLGDKFAPRKIIDFLPKELKGVYHVGRLDKNSCGLIILTNDGNLCYHLTHPKFEIEKEYLVKVTGKIMTEVDCDKAKQGIEDKGDFLKVKDIEILKQNKSRPFLQDIEKELDKNESFAKVIICEGKKRHLRRLFRGLGFTVKHLERVRIGRLKLGNLKQGEYRLIEKEKIYSLFNSCLPPACR